MIETDYHPNWQQNRVKYILNRFPKGFFKGKRILELGAYNGYIGSRLANEGAIVHCVEGRQENVNRIKRDYPNVTAELFNLDTPEWKFGNWDIILNFGLYYHLEDFHKEHLINCINNCDLFIFETVIYDSFDSEIYWRKEIGNDQSLSDIGGTPSTKYVEDILKFFDTKFEKITDSSLNGNCHHYDWNDQNSRKFDQFARRLWIVKKNKKNALLDKFQGKTFALLYAGPYRGSAEILENHKRTFGNNIDMYVSCFDHYVQDWKNSGFPIKEYFITPGINFQDTDWYTHRSDPSGQSGFWQFWNLRNIMKEVPKKYDFYIKCRNDLSFNNTLEECLEHIELYPNILYSPNNSFHGKDWVTSQWVNDEFYIGCENTMKVISDMVTDFFKKSNRQKRINPLSNEHMLRQWLKENNIHLEKIHNFTYLKNHNGITVPTGIMGEHAFQLENTEKLLNSEKLLNVRKKSCTIITTHPAKFNFAINLLESFDRFVEKPHDLYFVFTNPEEESKFINECKSKNYKSIILPENLRYKKSIVNVKKLYAIESLINQYEYFGVYDCETEFVRPCNLDAIYEDIGNRNFIKGNINQKTGTLITSVVSDILGLSNNESLIKETEGFSIYWWFNEIPVYEREKFIDFISWLKSHPRYDQIQNEIYCFDYLLYSIWLISYRDYKIQKIETSAISDIGALEDFQLPLEVRDEISEKFDSYWSTNTNSYRNYEKIKLLFHLDRFNSRI
jgi:hypothetical protein